MWLPAVESLGLAMGAGLATLCIWLSVLQVRQDLGSDDYSAMDVTYFAILYASTTAFAWWRMGRSRQIFGPVPRMAAMVGLVSACILFQGYFLLLEALGLVAQQEPEFGTRWWAVLADSVLFVVMSPLAEELFFRGYWFPILLEGTSRWKAYAVTSVMFGAFHLPDIDVAVGCVGLGIVLAWLRESTGNLSASLATHASANLLLVLRSYVGHVQ